MSKTIEQKKAEHEAAVKAAGAAWTRYYADPTEENRRACAELGMACEIARWALTL